MICQHCGLERATTQLSCPRCGSTQLSLPSQGRPVIVLSGQEAHVPLSIPTRVTTLPAAQTLLTMQREAHVLAPGRTLQGQQYHLLVQQERRQWSREVSEIWWLAQDTERGNPVTVCELALPLVGTALHAFLRSATKAVMLRSTHPQVSALLNVFLEQGRGFFVFAHPDGESLQARVGRRGLLSEAEAIEGYEQFADALRFFSEQYPPLVHGSIHPDHLVQVGSRWVLTHGSPLVAGGVTQFVPALATTRLAAQSTPAADLSALSAVIYYAVIGRVPPVEVGEQQAQVLRARLSPTFAAVLLKGVHPRQQERYQSPSELLEALGRYPTLRHEGGQRQRRRSALGQVPQQSVPVQAQNDRATVVATTPVEPPRPAQPSQGGRQRIPSEDLLPVAPGHDRLTALGWASAVLLVGMIILLVAR